MLGTDPQEHKKGCPYLSWYNDNARWQPRDALSEVARKVMVETVCTCAAQQVVQADMGVAVSASMYTLPPPDASPY